MSSVNNTNNVQDPNATNPTLYPIDPAGTPTPSSSSTTQAQNAYYSSEIAPASTNTSSTTATSNAGTPVLSSSGSNEVSIAAYGKSVSEAVRLFKESSGQDMRSDINIIRNYHYSTLQDLLALQAFLAWAYNFEKIAAELQQKYQDAAAPVNQQISDFNNSTLTADDKAAIKTMNDATTKYNDALAAYNQAVADHNSGALSDDDFAKATDAFNTAQTTYNTAVGVYNAYGANRNTVLPGLIDQFNQNVVANFDTNMADLYKLIDQYNQQAAAKNLPPMRYPPKPAQLDPNAYTWQPLPTSPTTYPVPTVPDRPQPLNTINVEVPVQAIQQQVDTIQEQINLAVDEQLAALKALCNERDTEEASLEYYKDKIRIQLNTANPLVDSSCVKSAVSDISTNTSNETSLVGSNFINMYGKTLSPDLLAALDKISDVKMTQEVKTKISQLLQVATAQYMIGSGLLGGKDAIDALGKQASTINTNGNAAQVAVALGFAKEVQKLSEGDFYEQTVEQVLKSQGITAPPDVVKQIAEDLKLNAALVSLFQISKAIQSPNLNHLIIGLAAGNAHPSVSTALNSKAVTSLFQTLREPVAKYAVKQAIEDALTHQQGLTKEKAEVIANRVIDHVAKRRAFGTEKELNNALVKQLIHAGIDPTKAPALAHQAVAVLKNEQQHPELNLILTRIDVDNAIQNDPLFLDPSVAKVVNQVRVNGDISSFRSFRDELTQEFQINGLSKTDATSKTGQVMAAVVAAAQSTQPQTAIKNDPVAAINPAAPANEEQIKNAVSAKTIQLLKKELDVPTSHQISHDLIEELLGDRETSVMNVIRDSMKRIGDLGSKAADQRLADWIKSYTAPDVEIYAFSKALSDPGTAVLYTAATGIMYQKNEPNYQNVNVLI